MRLDTHLSCPAEIENKILPQYLVAILSDYSQFTIYESTGTWYGTRVPTTCTLQYNYISSTGSVLFLQLPFCGRRA
jgi:hypothetical protein